MDHPEKLDSESEWSWWAITEHLVELHSSMPVWSIPCTEEPGELRSMGSQRVGHNWATKHAQTVWSYLYFLKSGFVMDGQMLVVTSRKTGKLRRWLMWGERWWWQWWGVKGQILEGGTQEDTHTCTHTQYYFIHFIMKILNLKKS